MLYPSGPRPAPQETSLRVGLSPELISAEAELRIPNRMTTLPRVRYSTDSWRKSDWAFNGTLREPIHRWYRLTASFSPAFVGRVLSEKVAHRVLDPFSGVGTTLLEASRLGHQATGVELNPFLRDISRLKCEISLIDDARVAAALIDVKRDYDTNEKATRGTRMASWKKNSLQPPVPPLYAIENWWPWAILRKLLLLRQSIDANTDEGAAERLLLRVALARVAMALDKQSHTSLSYPKLARRFEPLTPFLDAVAEMRADVRLAKIPGSARCLRGDSRHLDRVLGGQKFDIVVTSPPYCNRFTYTRQTRPMLYFLGYFHNTRQSGDLDIDAVGGTWGRATDRLRRVVKEPDPGAVRAVQRVARLEGASRFAHNYVVEYCNALYSHLSSLQGHLNDGAELHYVIGNSYLYGIEIPADRMLGDLMQAAGYSVRKIERVRRRHSRVDLYEAHVIAQAG